MDIVTVGIALGLAPVVLVVMVNAAMLFMMFMLADIIGHEHNQGEEHDQT